jgi:predicted nucleotidyltransferase
MDQERIDQYLNELIEEIKSHNPLEIILFGSFSKKSFTSDSDIDLLVILDLDSIPNTYEEKMSLKSSIRKSIREINKKVAIDLLVYTKKEIQIMKEENNAFWEEINKTGKIMYEKAS